MLAGVERLVQLRKKKGMRSVRIEVGAKGIAVSMPWHCSTHEALRFVAAKEQWITRQCRLFEKGLCITLDEPFAVVKARAHERLRNAVDRYAVLMGVSYKTVAVKRYKSRWGSCSHDGHLSFNYTLGVLPDEMVTYVVVHELAHLAEFNHSPRFWNIVEQWCPDYRATRRSMKYLYFV